MIRMGRSSSKEQTNEAQTYREQPSSTGNVYQHQNEAKPTPSRALSESESMARDIKEGRLSGFVGYGTVLTGETNFQAMLRIDGHLTGRVSSESGTLIVGSSGRVDANITVAAAVINGIVNGDIICFEKLELGRSARVIGNIQAPRLVIEDGAVLEGSCTMIKAREALEKQTAQTAAGDYAAYETGDEQNAPVAYAEMEEPTETAAS